MRMIAYTRVSTDGQADDGHGLDAQDLTIRQEADRRGWDLIWFSDPGYSGKNTRRPQLAAALAALRAHQFDGLVVSKLDRLSRSVMDFAVILRDAERQGWKVIALDLGVDTSTPTGELVANIMISVGQWERRIIGQRTKEGLAAARQKGVRLGAERRIPADVADRITALHADGCSAQAIARVLNDDAVPCTKSGARWHHTTVRRVLNYTTAVPACA